MCIKFIHSMHKVCIRYVIFGIKSALLYHLLSTKCAPSVPDADFADLVHTVKTKGSVKTKAQ